MSNVHTIQLRVEYPNNMNVAGVTSLVESMIKGYSLNERDSLAASDLDISVIKSAPHNAALAPAPELLATAIDVADTLAGLGGHMLCGQECAQVVRVMQALISILAPVDMQEPDSYFESICKEIADAEAASVLASDLLLTSTDCVEIVRWHALANLTGARSHSDRASKGDHGAQ